VRNPANLGPFLYLSIALSALVDWAVYDIVPSRLAVPGGILVFASAVVVSWRTFHVAASQQRSEQMQ
jgi:drug/metabolite transporter (DMT)-like permease